MVSWKAAYSRLRDTRTFASFFARDGRVPGEVDWDLKVYAQVFETVPNSATAGIPGDPVGPLTQVFAQGSVILGVTASCLAPQQVDTDAAYRPSYNPGNRDLFALFLSFTDGELITQSQTELRVTAPPALNLLQQARVLAESMLSGGVKQRFPEDEIVVAPSQGISVLVASLLDSTNSRPTLTVHVAFHAMVPRGSEKKVAVAA